MEKVFNERGINFYNLVKNQIPINYKFPNPNRGSRVVDVYDSMAGQVLEEVHEYNNEVRTQQYINDKTKAYEELIDVIMYSGSLWIETSYALGYCKKDIEDFFNNNEIFNDYNVVHADDDKDTIYTNGLLTAEWLGCSRRHIYDRKYHKPTPAKPDDYEKELLQFIIFNTLFGLSQVLTDIFEREGSLEILNTYIEKKETFISNL